MHNSGASRREGAKSRLTVIPGRDEGASRNDGLAV